jgi:hypothetical protein
VPLSRKVLYVLDGLSTGTVRAVGQIPYVWGVACTEHFTVGRCRMCGVGRGTYVPVLILLTRLTPYVQGGACTVFTDIV